MKVHCYVEQLKADGGLDDLELLRNFNGISVIFSDRRNG